VIELERETKEKKNIKQKVKKIIKEKKTNLNNSFFQAMAAGPLVTPSKNLISVTISLFSDELMFDLNPLGGSFVSFTLL
jgi:hypothetical protein